jgi:hypothetical protein
MQSIRGWVVSYDQGWSQGVAPEDTPSTKQVPKLSEEIRKRGSALLTQAGTGRVGLAKFLYGRRVPGFTAATCQCRAGHETPHHIALY